MSTFWSGWIIVLSVGNVLACVWLILWTMKKRSGESAQGEVTGHKWDGTLEEFNNPLPRWWLWLFWITIIFTLVYFVLYPGLGTFKGVLDWSSQGSQYQGEMQAAADKYDPIYEKYAAVAVADLATGSEYQEARDMGKRLFLTYCMQCHGSTASGADGFPNLTDNDWLWGGSPEQIKMTITNGRMGVMPAHAHLGDEKIEQAANFVLSLSGRPHDAAKAQSGKQVFMTAGCIGCHGVDAKGNQMLGGPNLTDSTWLYRANLDMTQADRIKETITGGRKGVMPAQKDLLGENKIHLLTAYVYSLSQK